MSAILYFVGAGLTKSLALPTHPVPALFDFVNTASEYLHDDVVLTTLAELENAEPGVYAWESPLARRLAQQLVGRNAQRTPDLRSRFAGALRDRPGESMEDLLDRTGGDASNLSSQNADLRFQYAISRLFALIEWNVNWNPLDSFLRRQFQIQADCHSFVSFNYDLILDRALERRAAHKLDLSTIYGFEPSGTVISDPNGSPSQAPEMRAVCRQSSAEIRLSLLKPHGSLNWWARVLSDRPPDEVWRDGTVVVPITVAGTLRYVLSTEPHQWVQPLDGMPFLVEPVILTPRGAKKPTRQFLARIREQEEQAIRSADEVYILGWSVPRTDSDQECLIRSTVAKRAKPFRRVTVVNLRAGVDYFKRVKDIFGVESQILRVFNSGFQEFVVSQLSSIDA
jgi:hypothetical protein